MFKDRKYTIEIEIIGLEWLKPLVAMITWKVDKILMTLQERFDALNAQLDEASAEILAELTKLREGGNLTPEQEQSLTNVETKVAALTSTSPPVG